MTELPSFLSAYPSLKDWRQGGRVHYSDWVLDSGAYSVWASGGQVDLGKYIAQCQECFTWPSPPSQVFSLDVIGDWRESRKNTERMWEAGVKATPCYHLGEPWDVLLSLAKDYPRIAIGGIARSPGKVKLEFAKQCFARVWPKVVHGFALCNRRWVEALPFASVDSASWFLQPVRYGLHKALSSTGREVSVRRGGVSSLKCEVDFYLDLQAEMRQKWAKQMEQIGIDGPTLYLGYPGGTVLTGYEKEVT